MSVASGRTWRPARLGDWASVRVLLAEDEAAWLSMIERCEAAMPWWHHRCWLLDGVGPGAIGGMFQVSGSLALLALSTRAAQPTSSWNFDGLERAARKPLESLGCLIARSPEAATFQSALTVCHHPLPIAENRYRLMRLDPPPGTAASPPREAGLARPGSWPSAQVRTAEWRGLLIRPAGTDDLDTLYELQCAYEQEEVLVPGHRFDPAATRRNLRAALTTQRVWCACAGTRIVAKAATNGRSWNLVQLGGVYTRPEWRGRGIATRVVAALLAEIFSHDLGASLFVKERNAPAQALYRSLGFSEQGPLTIAYY